MTDEPNWREVARRIKAARKDKGISARAAARLAPMSPTYWQDLERGHRSDGGRISLSDRMLANAARVVGLDPAPLFALVGRSYKPPPTGWDTEPTIGDLAARVDTIEEVQANMGETMAEILRIVTAADHRVRGQGTR